MTTRMVPKTTGRILVVDDNALDRTVLATCMKDAGHIVEEAQNGLQALQALRTQPFDLVLLDLLMPEMNGFQVLEHMLGSSVLQHIPVIVISAGDEMDDIVRCIAMGATDYVIKPFDLVRLDTRVNASLAISNKQHSCVEEQVTKGKILVVDDDWLSRKLLSTRLEEDGYTVEMAENGRQALAMLRTQPFDVILLDLLMPEMDGFQVLQSLKADSTWQHIPVIIISAEGEMDSVIRCIEMGATDHLPKPFNPAVLGARLDASLAAKRLHDQEQAYLKIIQDERQKSERLLLNILPKPVADRLKLGEEIIADSFADVTILFADIVGFTPLSAHLSPKEVVVLLNEVFSMFDSLVEQYGLEKIKTVGDAYMVVGGLPTPRPDHAEAVADLALDMQKGIALANVGPYLGQAPTLLRSPDRSLDIRIGINTGPVIAGVIGTKKFSYDLWGDAVNVASRMESQGIVGQIQVTTATYERLRDKYWFEERGLVQVRGKGNMLTYLLVGRNAPASLAV